jgi:hypothetical protein
MNVSAPERVIAAVTVLSVGYRLVTGEWPISVEVDDA